MATTYTWKVTTLEHDRALETYLNKANAEEGWEVVFILPAERPGRATVVVRKALASAAELEASENGAGSVIQAASATPLLQEEEKPSPTESRKKPVRPSAASKRKG
jgi:hypothetical protein